MLDTLINKKNNKIMNDENNILDSTINEYSTNIEDIIMNCVETLPTSYKIYYNNKIYKEFTKIYNLLVKKFIQTNA